MQAKGSDQAVVRARLKGQDPVEFLGADGDTHKGQIAQFPDAPADVQAVTIRYVQIEQDEVDPDEITQGLRAGADDLDGEPAPGQGGFEGRDPGVGRHKTYVQGGHSPSAAGIGLARCGTRARAHRTFRDSFGRQRYGRIP